MRLFCTLAIAAIVSFSLSGCNDGPIKPVEIQKVQSTIVPLPEPTRIVEPAATVPVVSPEPVTLIEPEPVIAPPAITPKTETIPEIATVNPLTEWFKNPTFTCEPGRAPGWINEQGVPTSCVAN
jgi:hypothetical protein